MPDLRPGPPLSLADLNVNYNEPPKGRTRVILGMKCHPVLWPEVVAVGDFSYHYSRQLDAFSIWEIVSVSPWRVVEIDSDMHDLRREPHEAGRPNGYTNTIWRSERAARYLWERDGFPRRTYWSTGGERPVENVRPQVTLYYVPPPLPAPVRAAVSAWARFRALFSKK